VTEGSANRLQGPDAARATVARYLAASPAEQDFSDDPLAKRAAKRVLPSRLRTRVAMRATDALRARERRRARALAAGRPLRLHLGSSRSRKPGWLNVDLVGYPVELAWNVRRPLPFGDATAEAIFHEHLLEHLSLEDGLRLTVECHRLLEPGGVLRVGVPDAGRYARSYADADGFIAEVRPGRPTPLLALQEVFYGSGHRTMYDADTLLLVLAAAGFETADVRDFGQSAIEPAPDSPHRRRETLYVEARR
jgi:hypothetical protein